MLKKKFYAYVEWDPVTKLYVGIIPGITGAHTQAETIEELRKNLQEVLELCLEEIKEVEEMPEFVGVQLIEVSA
jgi:predicted RNase H-like HicB family nuclease